jgi:hypothetical protein
MLNTRLNTPSSSRRGQARARDSWRDSAALVGLRWQAFLEADSPASRSRAFASYAAALDAEQAAASELALLSSFDVAA